jgi:hypothetical protein
MWQRNVDMRKRDWNRTQAAEMKYLRTVKGCTRFDQIRNEDIRNELGISPLSENIIEYRNTWKAHLQRMEHTHYRHININHPENET